MLKDVARRIAGEDTKQGARARALGRPSARTASCAARELDAVAAWAEVRARAPTRRPVADARRAGKGTAKGNAARRRSSASPLYLAGDDDALDAKKDDGLVARMLEAKGETQKELDKARAASAAACWPTSSATPPSLARGGARRAPRDLANDLCLKTDGRMSKDDVKVIEAWALKVREA